MNKKQFLRTEKFLQHLKVCSKLVPLNQARQEKQENISCDGGHDVIKNSTLIFQLRLPNETCTMHTAITCYTCYQKQTIFIYCSASKHWLAVLTAIERRTNTYNSNNYRFINVDYHNGCNNRTVYDLSLMNKKIIVGMGMEM